MSEEDRKIYCLECGAKLDNSFLESENRKPCPECGSKKRDIKLNVHENISTHESVGIKGKSPEYKSKNHKYAIEIKMEDSYRRDSKEWCDLEQVYDRKNDYHKEKIIGQKTGTVYKNKEGKLSDHHGHGSAKKKKEKPETTKETPKKNEE